VPSVRVPLDFGRRLFARMPPGHVEEPWAGACKASDLVADEGAAPQSAPILCVRRLAASDRHGEWKHVLLERRDRGVRVDDS